MHIKTNRGPPTDLEMSTITPSSHRDRKRKVTKVPISSTDDHACDSLPGSRWLLYSRIYRNWSMSRIGIQVWSVLPFDAARSTSKSSIHTCRMLEQGYGKAALLRDQKRLGDTRTFQRQETEVSLHLGFNNVVNFFSTNQ